MRGRAKRVSGELTDDDLDRIAGSCDRFVGVPQERYGKEEAEQKNDEELGTGG